MEEKERRTLKSNKGRIMKGKEGGKRRNTRKERMMEEEEEDEEWMGRTN